MGNLECHILLLLKAQVSPSNAAFNDASWPLDVGPAPRALLWLQQRSITYLFLKERVTIDRRVMVVSRWIGRRLPARLDESTLQRHLDQLRGVNRTQP